MSKTINRLDLNLLRVFLAIYDSRNISRAAVELNVSQPTMSNSLGKLRVSLEDQLFVREARGVRPTSRAEKLAPSIRKILQAADEIVDPDQAFDPRTSDRKFQLCIIDALEPLIIPHLLKQAGPGTGLAFELLLAPGTVIETALQSGQAEVVVNLPAELHKDIAWEALCPLDLVIIARKGHPEVDGTVTLEQVKSLPHVSLDMKADRMANTRLLRTTKSIGFKSTVVVSRTGSLVDLVTKTDLIAVVMRAHAENSPAADQLQIIQPSWQASNQNVHMTWHKRTDQDQALVWLRSAIRSCFM